MASSSLLPPLARLSRLERRTPLAASAWLDRKTFPALIYCARHGRGARLLHTPPAHLRHTLCSTGLSISRATLSPSLTSLCNLRTTGLASAPLQPQYRHRSLSTKPPPSSTSPLGTSTPASTTQPRNAVQDDTGKAPSLETPIAHSIETARECTKAVGAKVRSSLTPHENIYNLPNALTVSRLIAAPTTAYLLLHDQHTWALALFAYAGITDLIDGWIARKWKLQTVAGSVMDPMADKALMIILTATLAIKGALPLYLAALILGRDASLAIAAIYYRYASLPAPKTFMRYWDFSLPSAEVHPTTVSKYNTFLQLILIGSTLALPVLSTTVLAGLNVDTTMTYFQWLVAGTTAWSGLSYAILKNAVTIMGSNEALKAKQGARGRAIIGVTFGSVVLAATWIAFTVDEPRREEKEKTTEQQVEASS
ncbi:Hypothetical protein R9X50_00490200 [Acrodontium crateriforme]|uniref:Cardiolipin synthase n=1 Tax=Acrodontium crateriforme TaxID=150365 RepID=A0AAQ3M6Y4_9PEZI|nr:Hypothetical protein R9X50_00490200 [Acrodontium crateriforme]